MSVSPQTMIDAVHTYVRALNESDVEAIVGMYAPDAIVEDPAGSPAKIGHQAIREFYTASVSNGLEVELEGEIRTGAVSCAFAFAVSFDIKGRYTTIRPIDVFDFDANGRVAHMRAYFGAPNIHS